jgi:hypothetical protein
MAENYRTTISAVYWTSSTEEAEAIADELNDVLPEADRSSTLVAAEYVSTGRPVPEPIAEIAPTNGEPPASEA